MEQDILVGLAVIVALGVGGQWLAGRMRIPSILVLLLAGFIVGPITGLVDPEAVFGELLFPAVSLATGLLLFDSGMGLRLSTLSIGRQPVLRLVTIGLLVTWVVGSVTAFLVTDLSSDLAVLLGAILVVSGPTVVIPILRRVRPRPSTGPILRWEATVIDPIGAVLGVVVLTVVLEEGNLVRDTVFGVASAAVTGIVVGLGGAALLLLALRYYRIPDLLRSPVAVAMAVVVFAATNLLFEEGGLFATTVLGIALANQRRVDVSDIAAFEKALGALILGSLFVLLGARIELSELADVWVAGIVLVVALVLVARPLAVAASVVGTEVSLREATFLAAMAPRGVVAAATSSVFALALAEASVAGGDLLAPLTFTVIMGTGLVYGLSAGPVARRLGVAGSAPRGVALVGSQPWVVRLGEELARADVPVLLMPGADDLSDTSLPRYAGTFGSEEFVDALATHDIGTALVMSADMEHNVVGVDRFVECLGAPHVYYLPRRAMGDRPVPLARRPFGTDVTQTTINERTDAGERILTLDLESGAPNSSSLPLIHIDTRGRPFIAPQHPHHGLAKSIVITGDSERL